MDLFLNKADSKLVKKLNKGLGTQYRTKPFDLNKKEDLIEAITYITAEYVDFYYYHNTIYEVMEYLDASIETYYPALWAKSYLEKASDEKGLRNVNRKLCDAEDALQGLRGQAEQQCREVWALIFQNASDEVLIELFGEVIRPTPEEFEELLNFEFMDKQLWKYQVPETARAFMEAMREHYTKLGELIEAKAKLDGKAGG